MDIHMIREMGRQRVENAKYPARKLALLFTGVTVGTSLLLSLAGALLQSGINKTVGLGGLQTRMVLSFIQTVLLVVTTLAIPFWNLGYTGAALKTARGEEASPKSLLAGFGKIFPAIRLFVLLAAVLFFACFLGMQLGAILFAMSPAAEGTIRILENTLKNVTVIDEVVTWNILTLAWPMLLTSFICMLVLLIPISYRLRLAEFSLMDGQNFAIPNLVGSYKKMRGNCLTFFRLDLGFWWYYLLQALAVGLGFGDQLFPGNQVAYWGFYIGSCVLQVVVSALFMPRVMATYAVAYDEIIKEKEQVI